MWYPSAQDAIDTNIDSLRMSGERHPHKILGSPRAIEAILNGVKAQERRGLSYQAALIMKEFVSVHVFAGANHRTAYGLAKLFLARNGQRLSVSDFGSAYPFIRSVRSKSVVAIQRWIEHGIP